MHARWQRDYVLDSHADDCHTQIERKVRIAPDLEQECFAIGRDITLSSAACNIDHHQYPDANPRPVNAEIAADGVHMSWLSMPCMTAATDSPSRIMVNKPKRSGTCSAPRVGSPRGNVPPDADQFLC